MKTRNLSEEEINRQDFVDGKIYKFIQSVIPRGKNVDWDIEAIGEIRDVIQGWVVDRWQLSSEMEFYPYMEHES